MKIKRFFQNIFHKIKDSVKTVADMLAEGRRGAEIILLLFGLLLSCGVLQSMYAFLPVYVFVPLAILLAGTVPFVFFAVFWLVFGTRQLVRAYFLTDLIFMTAFGVIGCQGNYILFVILFTAATVLALDLLGRCICLLFKKNRSKTMIVAGAVSFLVLTAAAVFLSADGFARGNTAKYADMQKTEASAPAGFAQSVEKGGLSFQTLTYGIGDTFMQQSDVFDLSDFAKRRFPESLLYKLRFDYEMDAVPLSGTIWYPEDKKNCPVLFMIHGNHDVEEDSYLGYAYLGEYLAGHGYVVVSVDENACNGLTDENDARAVLLLENIRQVLAWNAEKTNPLYGRIDAGKIALGGHSRGGEAICHAALFNRYRHYPDNANIPFDYDFPITSLIAVAPVCDQYLPADKTVELQDVNYLLIHGLNDQDVSQVMGEKQYNNVRFSGTGTFLKAAVCINGANHGQFNSLWGRYDCPEPTCRMLDVHELIPEREQQRLLCILMKTFMDVTLLQDDTYLSLFSGIEDYRAELPQTAYQQMYQDNTFETWADFDTQEDIGYPAGSDCTIEVTGSSAWAEKRRKVSSDGDGANYALAFRWGDDQDKDNDKDGEDDKAEQAQPISVLIRTGDMDLRDSAFSADITDMRTKDTEDANPISYTVIFTDRNGAVVKAEEPREVLPSIGVQLYKQEALLRKYTYKHQFTTVRVSPEEIAGDQTFDAGHITQIELRFSDPAGDMEIDNIGKCRYERR